MLTKSRTIIMTLVAAGSFAAAAVAPAVSQAKKVKPGQTTKSFCKELSVDHKIAVELAKGAQADGNPALAKEYAEEAERFSVMGAVEGCGWAVAHERIAEAPGPTGEKPIVEAPPKPPVVKEGPVRPPTSLG